MNSFEKGMCKLEEFQGVGHFDDDELIAIVDAMKLALLAQKQEFIKIVNDWCNDDTGLKELKKRIEEGLR